MIEPICWRTYTDARGATKKLKPDMFAITASDEYEYNWFLEVDRATEAPSTVLRKCAQYAAYYKTGAEQQKYSVFPVVVWLVPDEKRQKSIASRIAKEITGKDARLFVAIVEKELESLVLNGAENFKNHLALSGDHGKIYVSGKEEFHEE
jgi:hypothetical protein